jgi:multiple sugar transport system permease protein
LNWLKKADITLNKPKYAAYVFIAPAIVIIVLFEIVPLLSSLIISTLNITTYFTNIKFIGLKNYITAFNDEAFWNAWKVTLIFTIFDVPVSVSFALLVAALVKGTRFTDKLFRAVYILPVICSSTVVGLMWSLFLNMNIGWGVWFMEKLGLGKVAIFSDYRMAIYGIIFISIWRGFGVSSLILVAAMQGVSQDLYEAAVLDGANKAQQFFNVTMPGIISTFWFILITRVIGSFQVFDLIYVITSGGPANSTRSMVNYIYETAFSAGTHRLGYATAMSELLFALIMLITVVLYRLMVQQERSVGAGE